MRQETDLNGEIGGLRDGGASFPKRASSVHISQEGARKRLRGRQGKDRVSTRKIPSLSPTAGINPSGNLSLRATGGQKEGNSPPSEDLIGEMLGFLKGKGVEVYRNEVEVESYQVRHNGQVVRLYVQRRQTGAS